MIHTNFAFRTTTHTQSPPIDLIKIPKYQNTTKPSFLLFKHSHYTFCQLNIKMSSQGVVSEKQGHDHALRVTKFTDLERRFGIEKYTTPNQPGFSAVLKARYSDFIVHEVDQNGQIAVLDSLVYRSDDLKSFGTNAGVDDGDHGSKRVKVDHDALQQNLKDKKQEGLLKNPKMQVEKMKLELKKLVGGEHSEKAVEMLEFWQHEKEEVADSLPFDKNYTFPMIEQKEKRKALHMLFRSELFAPFSLADTHERRVRIWHLKHKKDIPNFGNFKEDHSTKKRSRTEMLNHKKWPSDRGGNYLRFVLYKENVDTITAVKDIMRTARLNPKKSSIGYSGMKDKRGITGQFCTLYRKEASDLVCINQLACGKSNSGGGSTKNSGKAVIRVGNFSYSSVDNKLGRLSGNRFDIVLRNVDLDSNKDGNFDLIEKSLESCAKCFKEEGFINYFGMQRFGKFHDTHEVGLAVLRDDFEGAVNIIMRVKENEQSDRSKDARKQWARRFEGIDMSIEKEVLNSERNIAKSVIKDLGRFNNSEVSLMESLSRNPRQYKQAFKRISRNMKLMFLHSVQSYIWNKATSYRIGLGHKVQVGDLILKQHKTEEEGGSGTSGLKGKEVCVVSEEDVEKYNISDVVLPLIGSKIQFPKNSTGTFIRSLLEENKLSIQNLSNRGELSLGGDYRHLIVKPDDIDYKIVRYKEPTQPLIETDLMKINGNKVDLNCTDIDKQNMLIGMIVGFTLPPSSYATVALRELMKRPTDSEYQGKLSLEKKR